MTSQSLSVEASAPNALVSRLLATDAAIAPVPLRLVLGLAMLPHGLQKAFGWFGGYGWDGTMGFLTQQIGMPAFLAGSVILLEVLGPLLLLAGLATRAVALSFIGLMLGAVVTVHAQHGFFMNWTGSQAGEGFEYHLLVIGAALALAFTGGGRWSLDRRLSGAN